MTQIKFASFLKLNKEYKYVVSFKWHVFKYMIYK